MTATQIPAHTLAATRAFAVRVAHAYPIQQAILFGSRARGIAHDESDVGVAVILSGVPRHFIETKMAKNHIACDILLDTGIRISHCPCVKTNGRAPNAIPISTCYIVVPAKFSFSTRNLYGAERDRAGVVFAALLSV